MAKNLYFETIKCEDNEVFNLDYHNKRVSNTIGKNLNLSEYIYPINNKLLRCKVIYNDYEIINVEFFEYKKREIKSFKIVENNDIDYSKKFLDRDDINKLFEKKQTCDEIVIFKNSFLTDTSIANIAIFYESFWITPKTPLLNGTTRQRLIDEGFLKEKDITKEMLKKAEKLALLNAMIGFDEIKDYSFFS